MIEYLRARMFQAKVQAELMAQHKDQGFANVLCHKFENMEHINSLRKNAYFKKDKVAPFIVVCDLLGRGIEDTTLSDEQQMLCAHLLTQRLERVIRNQQFRLKHLLIFGELEEKLKSWITNHASLYEAT